MDYQGHMVNLGEMIVDNVEEDDGDIDVELIRAEDGEEIRIRYDSRLVDSEDDANYLLGLDEGDAINIEDMILGWFHGPELLYTSKDEIEIVTISESLMETYLEREITLPDETTEDLDLIEFYHVGGWSLTFTWESSDTAHITDEGEVTRPEAGEDDVDVTLTATVTDNNDYEKELTFLVTVLAEPDIDWNFVETFEGMDTHIGYEDGTFTGVDDIEWIYVDAIVEGSHVDEGQSIRFRGDDEPSTLEATIENGISDLRIDFAKDFTNDAGFIVKINDEKVGSVVADEDGVHSLLIEDIDVPSEFTLELIATEAQTNIDVISWTTYEPTDIADVHAELEFGDMALIQGVVTAMDPNVFFMEDDTGAIVIFCGELHDEVSVGDEVLIQGEYGEFNGQLQLENVEHSEILAHDQELPPLVDIDDVDLEDDEAMKTYQSHRVILTGMEVIDVIETAQDFIWVTLQRDDGKEIIIRAHPDLPEFDEIGPELLDLEEGDIIDIEGMALDWSEGPRLMPTAPGEYEIVNNED